NGLARRVDESFAQAVAVIPAAESRIIIPGMGKSGIIGHKIAATFSSTGTTAYFTHPAEAFHGDLVILISYSGETGEAVRLLPSLKRSGVAIVSPVGNPDSTVARESDIVLDVPVRREACPNNLAPTTSTMTALAMGDALAVALIERRRGRVG
ncbi:MAG TPA: SIS domain-containing protein, partial [Geminicoccaceae bacterium]|nr:SIS domain-containing protein [Geminicoccaceae bacterium]